MIRRLPFWERLLAEFVESRRSASFIWGERDCCLFAADGILAITGFDPARPYRGTYSTQIGAHKLILRAGGLSAMVELPEIPVLMAGRGDVVLIDTKDGEALGLHLGTRIAAQGPGGVTFLPVSEVEKSWKGGE